MPRMAKAVRSEVKVSGWEGKGTEGNQRVVTLVGRYRPGLENPRTVLDEPMVQSNESRLLRCASGTRLYTEPDRTRKARKQDRNNTKRSYETIPTQYERTPPTKPGSPLNSIAPRPPGSSQQDKAHSLTPLCPLVSVAHGS